MLNHLNSTFLGLDHVSSTLVLSLRHATCLFVGLPLGPLQVLRDGTWGGENMGGS